MAATQAKPAAQSLMPIRVDSTWKRQLTACDLRQSRAGAGHAIETVVFARSVATKQSRTPDSALLLDCFADARNDRFSITPPRSKS
ncbi:MAG TPA: hypothetical protein PLY54_07255, partial [Ottowia sp.]|nr:hypothetical protein [Ottowia sp.]